MKASIAILLIFSLSFCMFSCKSSVEESPSLPTLGDIEEDLPQNGEKLFFDESGNLQKIVKYQNGAVLSVREYSSDGRFIRYTEYTEYGHFTEDKLHGNINAKISYFDKNSLLTHAVSYSYHENGVVASETAYASDGSVTGVWHFDDSGSSTETDFYALDGEKYVFIETAKYFYYDDGTPEKTIFCKDGESPFSEIRYNVEGNIEQVIYYDGSGEISSYTLFGYSEDGSLISEGRYTSDGNITFLLLYDEDQNKISLTNYGENSLPVLVYKYQSGGWLAEIERYTEDGKLSSTEYFDENGARTGATFYNHDGSYLLCDSNFNPVEGVKYTHDSDGGYVKYLYESSVLREETLCRDGINLDSFRIFNENGLLSEETLYIGGRFDIRRTYQRNELGDVISYTEHELNGSTLVYSSDGVLVSGVRYFYSKGELSKKIDYENGVISQETLYASGSAVLISLFDENGTLAKESFYSSGKISRVKEYDENGVLRKDSVYNAKGKVSSVTKYDEKGNKI